MPPVFGNGVEELFLFAYQTMDIYQHLARLPNTDVEEGPEFMTIAILFSVFFKIIIFF